MLSNRLMIKRIFLSMIIILILFNHSSNLCNFIYTAVAADIEVEEIDENGVNEDNAEDSSSKIEVDDEEEAENNSGIEVEENIENVLIDDGIYNTYRNSVLYENTSLDENFSSIEIDEEATLQDAAVSVSSKINKKVLIEEGLLVEESIKVSINRNGNYISNTIISIDDIAYDNLMPIHKEIVGKNNISNADSIKILESGLNNSGDDINLEYKLILIYPNEIKNVDELIHKGTIILENDKENVKLDFDTKDTNEDEVENIEAKLDYSSSEDKIYKSYMKASNVSETKYDTEYSQKLKIDILGANLNEWYEIDSGVDAFETNEADILLDDEIRFIQTEISKDNFEEVIGNDGFIEVYHHENLIGNIDSSNLKDDKYVFEYHEDYDQIEFKIIGANKGTLEVSNKKAIIGTDRYSKEMISRIQGIKSKVNEKVLTFIDNKEVVVQKLSKDITIKLEEGQSKATLEIDNSIFSTNMDNEVSFTIDIDNSSEEYELFSNPSFDILLPSMISDVEIESVSLLNKNGLSLDTWKIEDNQNGNKVIKINLEGYQKEYNPKMSLPDTQIIVDTILKVNDLTPTGTTNVRMTYTNEISDRLSYVIEGNDSYSCEASYYSNVGILSLTQLEKYNQAGEKIYHIGKEPTIGKLDTNGNEKTATMDITIVNNYNKDINNVVIVGRIPAEGMVDSNLEKLHSTFDTKLKGSINTSGLLSKVYYSNKLDCEIDDDSWIESPEDYSTIKSFKVVIDGGSMSHGEMEKISYQLVIPENLGSNQKVYSLYTTYYEYENQNCKEESSIGLETEAATITLEDCQNNFSVETNKKALKVGTRATAAGIDLIDGEDVNYGQMIRYTYVISNDSNETINNIKLVGSVHNGNMYYREIYDNISSTDGSNAPIYKDLEDKDGTHRTSELSIDSLKPGESQIFTYQIFARNNQADGSRDVYGTLKVTADGIEEQEIKTVSNNIIDSEIELEVFPATQEPVSVVNIPSCNSYDFFIRVRNNTKEAIDNLVVKVDMSKFLTLNELKSIAISTFLTGYVETENKNVAQFTIDHIPGEQDYYLRLPVNIGEIDLDTFLENISVLARSNYNNRNYYSNDYLRSIEQVNTKYETVIYSNPKTESVVSKGDKVEFRVEVENVGLVKTKVEFGTPIPNGLRVDSYEYLYPNGERVYYDRETGEIPESTTDGYVISPNEKMIINIKCTVDQDDFGTEVDKMEFTLDSDTLKSNTIVYYINPDDIIHEGWNKDDKVDEEVETEINPEDTAVEYEINEPPVEDIETPIEEEPEEIIDNGNSNIDNNISSNQDTNEEVTYAEESDDLVIVEKETDKKDIIRSTEDTIARNNIATQTAFVKTVNKYNIGGTVWLDSNRDGIALDEDKISDINVYLYKSEIKENTLVKSVKTDSNGNYEFSEIEEGDYYIVFDYDNNEYSITKYNTSAPKNSIISKCSKKAFDINGNTKFYAISEKISLDNSIDNINLGLAPKSVFDFSIKSSIEQVYIKYSDEYKEYNFGEDDKLPKVEINRKKAENSTVTMKICIEVENIGNISGYILQLKEVLPEGFMLDEKQNMNWTSGKDNSFYYSGLAKERLQPSETKRIYLVVYKNIGDSSLGTFNNEVSIEETSNDELVEETNIENNNSTQNFILSISTGAATYVLLVGLLILVLAFAAITISNKVIPNSKNKKVIIRIIILGFIIISIMLLIINTYANGGDSYNGNNIMTIVESSYDNYAANIVPKLKVYPSSWKKYYTGGSGSGQMDERRLQCMEGLDVKGGISNSFDTDGSGRGIASIMNYDSKNDTYSTKAINKKTYSGDSRSAGAYSYSASRLAYMGYAAEKNYASGTNIWDKKRGFQDLLYTINSSHQVTANNAFTQMIGYSYSISFAGTFTDASDHGVYARLSAAVKDFKTKINNSSHSSTVDKIRPSDVSVRLDENNRIGPFYVKCPVNSYSGYSKKFGSTTYNVGKDHITSRIVFEYKQTSTGQWKPVKGDIYYNGTKVASTDRNGAILPNRNGTYYDISNKEVYILPTTTLDYGNISRFSITDYRYEFETKGVSFFGTTNYGDTSDFQDLISLKGKRYDYHPWTDWGFIAYKMRTNKYVDTVYKSSGNSIISGSGVPYNSTRATASEASKAQKPVPVDAGDIVVYKVDVKNQGVSVNSIKFKDEYDAGLQLLGIGTSNNGTYNATSAGGWTRNGSQFTYNSNIGTGDTKSIYLYFKVKPDGISKNNVKYNNKVTLTSVKKGSSEVISKLVASSKKESRDVVNLKTYAITMDKNIVKIGSSSTPTKNGYAEPGDYVYMKVDVKNNSTTSKVFGNLAGIVFTDITTFTNGYNFADYVQFDGFAETLDATTYSTNLTTSKMRVRASGQTYNVEFLEELTPSSTQSIYIRYKVKSTIKNQNLIATNKATLTALKNRNGIDLFSKINSINTGTTAPSAKFTIKKYNLDFGKKVQSIVSRREANLNPNSGRCEWGDEITFRISLVNKGTDANLNGPIKKVLIEDVLDREAFEFISATSTPTGVMSYDGAANRIKYESSGGLAVKSTAYIDIKVRVKYVSSDTKTFYNTAKILNIINKNSVTLYNGTTEIIQTNKYTETQELKYQTYHATFDKTVSKVNSQSINSRVEMDDTTRFNAPVEVEKNDIVVYSINLHNNTTGNNNDLTNLYQLTFEDIAEDGISLNKDNVKVTVDNQDVRVNVTLDNQKMTINILNNYALKVGKNLNILIEAKVSKSNFYLRNLENMVNLTNIRNRNDKDIMPILNGELDTKNKDYIRLKNLFISGNVWEDVNRDGLINDTEQGIAGIQVRLIDLTNKKLISTQTDSNGDYKFGSANARGTIIQNLSMDHGALLYDMTTNQAPDLMCDGEGRVVKATIRDETTGNYIRDSVYIDYVIEYEYDGIHYYTTTYAGRTNINDDLSYKPDYENDSNAHESNFYRDAFYDSLDTISYNKATGTKGEERELVYTKDGHKSTIDTSNLHLSAYSFGDGENITPLWLEKSDKSVLGESEYLKHINLGLIYKSADLEVKSDIESIRTYINGENVKYEYGQGDIEGSEYNGDYRTGGEANPKDYELKIYSSDYYYQSSDYKDEIIKEYKENTELEIQVKYKFTIYNKSNNNDTTYARVKEITDYYARVFKTDLDSQTTIRIYNSEGDLVDTQINNFIISEDYNYSKTPHYVDKSGSDAALNKVYLQTPIDIEEGGKAEFTIKFILGKETKALDSGDLVKLLKLNNGETISNIIEINAYSIYKKNSTETFGLIDEDSNPGNISSNEDISQYEDDTYESRLRITKRADTTTPDPTPDTTPDTTPGNPPDKVSERKIIGIVWEDVRSEEVGDSSEIQYVGNGIYNTSDQKNEKAMSLNTNEYKDKAIAGVTAHLVEEIRIKQDDGSYKLYEYDWGTSESEAYKELSENKVQKYVSTSDASGKYLLQSMIPGIYKVRFYYGDKDENGNIGENEIKYNGQDFKSSQYKGIEQNVESINKLFAYEEDINEDIELMMEEAKNDAIDDELRRLESMAFAEVQTNKNQSIINQTNIINSTDANRDANKREFADKTYMFADTAHMKINTEFTRNAENKVELNKKIFSFSTINDLFNKLDYVYKINNIDYGIEYRPKSAVSLNKYITEFKVVLSDKTVLSDIILDEVYDEVSHALIGTCLNREKSVGIENIMITSSNYDQLNQIILTVDPEIIQGASVLINYAFAVKNEGEIDRISINLDNIRNSYERVLNSSESEGLINKTISAIAFKRLLNDYNIDYTRETSSINLGDDIDNLKYKLLYNTSDNEGYYGKYLGTTYYTANINNDVLAKTKVSGIVDYVPVGLEFNQDYNIGENHYWTSISFEELTNKYISNSILETKEGDSRPNIYDRFNKTYYDYDSKKSNFVLSVDESPYNTLNVEQNKSLSRMLLPLQADDYALVNGEGTTKSSGMISLTTSKTLDNSKELEDLWYVNTAEIVQIISQTARCTPTDRDVIGIDSSENNNPYTSPINIPDWAENDPEFRGEISRHLIATIGNFEPKEIFNFEEADNTTADPVLMLPPTGKTPFYAKPKTKAITTSSLSVGVLLIAFMVIGKNRVAIKRFMKKKKIRISFKKYYK